MKNGLILTIVLTTLLIAQHGFTDYPIVFIPEGAFISFSNQDIIPAPIYAVEPGKDAYPFFHKMKTGKGKVKVMFRGGDEPIIQDVDQPLDLDNQTVTLLDFIQGCNTDSELLAFCPHPDIAGLYFTEGPVFLYGGDAIQRFEKQFPKPTEYDADSDDSDNYLNNTSNNTSNTIEENQPEDISILELQSKRYQERLIYNSLTQFTQGRLKQRKVNQQIFNSLTYKGQTLVPTEDNLVTIKVLSLPTVGSSTMVILPNEDVVFIDCGTRSDVEPILQRIQAHEYHANKSLHTLQYHFIITQLHPDTMGGFKGIIEAIGPKVGTVVYNSYLEPIPEEDSDESESNEPNNTPPNRSNNEPTDEEAEKEVREAYEARYLREIESMLPASHFQEQELPQNPLSIKIVYAEGSKLTFEYKETPELLELTEPRIFDFLHGKTGTSTEFLLTQNMDEEVTIPADKSVIVKVKANNFGTFFPGSNNFRTIEALDAFEKAMQTSYAEFSSEYGELFFRWTENVNLIYHQLLNISPEEREELDAEAYVHPVDVIPALLHEAYAYEEQLPTMQEEYGNLAEVLYQIYLHYNEMNSLLSVMEYIEECSLESEYYYWPHHASLSPVMERAITQFFNTIQPIRMAFSIEKTSIDHVEFPAMYDFIQRLNSLLNYNTYYQYIQPVCTLHWEDKIIDTRYEYIESYDGPPQINVTEKWMLFKTSLEDVIFTY